ncbi:hypothetical protein EJ04DRAFT_102520 [Polyplosphaeria fusca]|uniref:Uncharacterized protein n=1 Tax=Polyplosphaeria fusca TaxID=682080 RepID=A0A9P4V4A3_9PLEO|nr:hypothetical protein EJ04DRAFT_102520 [Polyplosphaeria fusca]
MSVTARPQRAGAARLDAANCRPEGQTHSTGLSALWPTVARDAGASASVRAACLWSRSRSRDARHVPRASAKQDGAQAAICARSWIDTGTLCSALLCCACHAREPDGGVFVAEHCACRASSSHTRHTDRGWTVAALSESLGNRLSLSRIGSSFCTHNRHPLHEKDAWRRRRCRLARCSSNLRGRSCPSICCPPGDNGMELASAPVRISTCARPPRIWGRA